MISVKNKKAIIVGASSGIGRSLAHLFSEKGAIVYLLSRTESKLKEVQNELPGESHIFAMDMLNGDAVNAVFDQIGAFDFLSFSAVSDETKLMSPIKSMPTEKATRGLQKFWGTFNVARAAANHISQGGAMVFTSSMSIYSPSKSGASVMNAASAAVDIFAKSLALEIAPTRVNTIAPGVVGTGVWTKAEKDRYTDWAKETLPVKHLGTPKELAHAFYMTLTNPYMTGSTVLVDGGLHSL
ncbi:SDR family oxidoreductase [Maribacter sp. 2-571]|uniref:SDR family oxidoreductase n=1 Tax=Maribacter sp. 2-571 TaxID=3417569 RepID=UPI003D34B27F